VWNGSRWSSQAVALPAGVSSGGLSGLSCSSARSCVAVGSVVDTVANAQRPWVVRWNGRAWSGQVLPAPAVSVSATLSGVSCVRSRSCWAVGEAVVTPDPTNPVCVASTRTLVEHWNGARWSIQPSPNPYAVCEGISDSTLSAVSCAAQAACMSVGNAVSAASGGGGQFTLVESWNGSAWSIGQTVDVDLSGGDNDLVDVSCTSRRSCTAVGNTDDANGNLIALIERWNGSRWTVQHGVPGDGGAALNAVSCTSPRFCFTVGSTPIGAAGADRPLIERYSPVR
jgi:hypothetical protein